MAQSPRKQLPTAARGYEGDSRTLSRLCCEGLQRNLQAPRHHWEEKGSPGALGGALGVPKVPLSLHPPWPRGLVTAATHGRFICGFTWKMLTAVLCSSIRGVLCQLFIY